MFLFVILSVSTRAYRCARWCCEGQELLQDCCTRFVFSNLQGSLWATARSGTNWFGWHAQDRQNATKPVVLRRREIGEATSVDNPPTSSAPGLGERLGSQWNLEARRVLPAGRGARV